MNAYFERKEKESITEKPQETENGLENSEAAPAPKRRRGRRPTKQTVPSSLLMLALGDAPANDSEWRESDGDVRDDDHQLPRKRANARKGGLRTNEKPPTPATPDPALPFAAMFESINPRSGERRAEISMAQSSMPSANTKLAS